MSAAAAMTRVLLAELRVHRLRLQLAINDLDAVGVALSSGLITPEQAIAKMFDMGLGDARVTVAHERRAA